MDNDRQKTSINWHTKSKTEHQTCWFQSCRWCTDLLYVVHRLVVIDDSVGLLWKLWDVRNQTLFSGRYKIESLQSSSVHVQVHSMMMSSMQNNLPAFMGHDFWSPWINENFGETKDCARLQSNFKKSNDSILNMPKYSDLITMSTIKSIKTMQLTKR